MTWRETISRVKKELKEINADSRLPNKLVYSKIVSKSSLVLQRESDALRLANISSMFQSLKCVEVKEVPAIDPHCKISSKYSIYRTVAKLPDLYFDTDGPIFGSITSVDRSFKVTLTTQNSIRRTLEDTNSRYDKDVYTWWEDNYLYLTKRVPLKLEGFFVNDVSKWCGCECPPDETDCYRFLDSEWKIPHRMEDQIISLVIQDLGGTWKRIPDQQAIDKNPNT